MKERTSFVAGSDAGIKAYVGLSLGSFRFMFPLTQAEGWTMKQIIGGFAALAILSGTAAAHPPAGEETTAHFLANEGVMIVDGETKILFDPLFRHDYANYQNLPDDIRAKLFAGEAPYDGVDVVFISHAHGDHFTAEDVNEYLLANTNVILLGPPQVIQAIKNDLSWRPSLAKRCIEVAEGMIYQYTEGAEELKPYQNIGITDGSDDPFDLSIEALWVPHAGGARMADIENIVYRVTLNKKATVMHLGDAAPEAENFTRHRDVLDEYRTHMAFVPDWFFAVLGGEATREMLNADKAIGIHVQVVVPQGLIDSGEDYFSKPGETRAIMYGNPN